jgi:hypothetical protein
MKIPSIMVKKQFLIFLLKKLIKQFDYIFFLYCKITLLLYNLTFSISKKKSIKKEYYIHYIKKNVIQVSYIKPRIIN